jgi:hypothetical protein
MRSFDPRLVGGRECRAWETYYRREWVAFLAASVGLVRAAFGMSWPRTLVGAWLVLRANQVWAPYAAWLEVEWWRVHREAQHGDGTGPSEELTVALRDLYAYSYSVDPSEVRAAAALRAEAMDVASLLAAVHR